MKIDFKQHILPHLIAIAIFFTVVSIYGSYEWQGKSLQSHDGVSYQGAAQEAKEYREEKGEQVLWNSRVFSGMPLFQMAYKVKENLVLESTKFFRSFMPSTVGTMFMLMIGFYFALLLFRVDNKVAVIISLGFGLSTWLLLSIEASHNTKIMVLAFVAPMLGSLYFAYNRKLLLGSVLVSFLVGVSIGWNHYQITYYSIFFIFIFVLFEFIKAVKEKKAQEFFKKSFVILGFTILGVLPNTARLWATYEYAPETMRGGKSELTQVETESGGLDKDYAMRWSYGKAETFNLLVPGLYAGGYHPGENSNLVKELKRKGVNKKQALQYAKSVPMYYGTQPFTSGPTYIGIVFFLLFGLLFFTEKSFLKWVFLSTSIIAIFFAWGGNFWGWNSIFFNNFPLFSKFRAPSMWLSMVIVAVSLGAAKSLHNIYTGNYEEEKLTKGLYIIIGSLGAILLGFILFGSSMFDFNGPSDTQLLQGGFPVDAIIKDRIALLKSDSIRALILLLLASAIIFAFIKKKLSSINIFIFGLGALIIFDMWSVGKRYFNEDDFKKVSKNIGTIPVTKADKQILNDDSYFRVFNTTVSSFNDNSTSFRHHSVGGYTAVKLYRYQDLIDNFLTQGNMSVFNMMNTKYFIQGEAGKEVANLNNEANGAAWFVNEIVWAENADDEVAKMKDFNSKNTAVIDKRFKENYENYTIKQAGSSNAIQLKEFHPDKMEYTTNNSADGYAVFSEIWYKGNKDWKAYIDGTEVSFERVNYLLRGLKIPAGNHEVVFEFKPKAHYIGKNISLVSSIVLLALMVFFVYREIRTEVK